MGFFSGVMNDGIFFTSDVINKNYATNITEVIINVFHQRECVQEWYASKDFTNKLKNHSIFTWEIIIKEPTTFNTNNLTLIAQSRPPKCTQCSRLRNYCRDIKKRDPLLFTRIVLIDHKGFRSRYHLIKSSAINQETDSARIRKAMSEQAS